MLRTVICCTVAALAAGGAHGATMYALNNLTTTGQDELIMFDSSNPSGYTVIGSTGVNDIGFGGLDFDASGNLWAYASFYRNTGGAAGGLYRIDMATGQAVAQGMASRQSLQDIAYDPTTGRMYGINTQRQYETTTLYEIDLVTGDVTAVGAFTGMPAEHNINGFAFDSRGAMYLQDAFGRAIWRAEADLNASVLYSLEELATVGSQGMTIDWSRDDQGYHAAVGQGEFPNYFSTINLFDINGTSYTIGGDFGPNDPDGLPPVQPGDIAIMPVPAPGAAALLLSASAGLARRRR